MSWWPFGGSSQQATKESENAFPTLTPYGGVMASPPELPKSLKYSSIPTAEDFKGFTPPPMMSSTASTKPQKEPTVVTSFFSDKKLATKDYDTADYSRFASSIRESPGIFDSKYAAMSHSTGFFDNYFAEHPRARNCWESVKTGAKMGSWVGAIFGGLTGLYAAALHRSILLLPVSMIGGGVSFGFFLGCGMLVRCEPASRNKSDAPPPAPLYIVSAQPRED